MNIYKYYVSRIEIISLVDQYLIFNLEINRKTAIVCNNDGIGLDITYR